VASINTAVFSSRPISYWILVITYPIDWLAVLKDEVSRFQLFATLTLDHIWFSRNKLVHEALQPVPAKVIKACFLLKSSSLCMARCCPIDLLFGFLQSLVVLRTHLCCGSCNH
jgi:hypothetical protein